MSIASATGLTTRDMTTITQILAKYPDVQEVVLFGSRAKGTHKQGSDIDLAIMNSYLNGTTLGRLKDDFEESSLPYFVDVLHFEAVDAPALREHITRVGVPLYVRQSPGEAAESQGVY